MSNADNLPKMAGKGTAQFKGADVLQKMQDLTENSPRVAQLKAAAKSTPVQRKGNKTGLPDNLKSGLETMSGMSMNDVKVHYNSPKPAQLQAHAYTQGSNIHVAPQQEKHVAHEAWHVVQQKQGRVAPTGKVGGMPLNDSPSLEREADVMGAKANSMPIQQMADDEKKLEE